MTYGRTAQTKFTEMRTQLSGLVTDVVAVRYFGPNSVTFKVQSGQLAAQFANALWADMGAMAASVTASTSNIAASLGGAPITIQIDGEPITPDAPTVVDYVDVDTAALEALIPVVEGRFTGLREGLAAHQTALNGTDWQGTAKETAVEAVATYTTSATGRCDNAQEQITTFIRNQINAAVTADH
ncbi:MAG: hypothetical protein ACK5OX_14345 [Desertimonas sp.]